MFEPKQLICVRCNRPVVVNAEHYGVFERMHRFCFHLEYEHEGDPDGMCRDPGCPIWHKRVFEEKLKEIGLKPEDVIAEAVERRFDKE